jgi:hypothetical protein
LKSPWLLLAALVVAITLTVAVSRTDMSGVGRLGSGVVLQLILGLGLVAWMLVREHKRQP